MNEEMLLFSNPKIIHLILFFKYLPKRTMEHSEIRPSLSSKKDDLLLQDTTTPSSLNQKVLLMSTSTVAVDEVLRHIHHQIARADSIGRNVTYDSHDCLSEVSFREIVSRRLLEQRIRLVTSSALRSVSSRTIRLEWGDGPRICNPLYDETPCPSDATNCVAWLKRVAMQVSDVCGRDRIVRGVNVVKTMSLSKLCEITLACHVKVAIIELLQVPVPNAVWCRVQEWANIIQSPNLSDAQRLIWAFSTALPHDDAHVEDDEKTPLMPCKCSALLDMTNKSCETCGMVSNRTLSTLPATVQLRLAEEKEKRLSDSLSIADRLHQVVADLGHEGLLTNKVVHTAVTDACTLDICQAAASGRPLRTALLAALLIILHPYASTYSRVGYSASYAQEHFAKIVFRMITGLRAGSSPSYIRRLFVQGLGWKYTDMGLSSDESKLTTTQDYVDAVEFNAKPSTRYGLKSPDDLDPVQAMVMRRNAWLFGFEQFDDEQRDFATNVIRHSDASTVFSEEKYVEHAVRCLREMESLKDEVRNRGQNAILTIYRAPRSTEPERMWLMHRLTQALLSPSLLPSFMRPEFFSL
jgi:hypothetical protein